MYTPIIPGAPLTPSGGGYHYHYSPAPAAPAMIITPHAPIIPLPAAGGTFIPAPMPPLVWTPSPVNTSAALYAPGAATPYLGTGQVLPCASLDCWPPTQRTSPIEVVPLLRPATSSWEVPALDWDIRKAPITAQLAGGRGFWMPLRDNAQAWDSQVVYPDSAGREIVVVPCQGMSHQIGQFSVRSQAGVRIRDLLDHIYDHFQESLSEAEYQRFCDDNSNGAQILYDAAKHRVRVEGGLPEANWRKGFKRVDTLGGDTQWSGAWPNIDHAYVWRLHVGFASRRWQA